MTTKKEKDAIIKKQAILDEYLKASRKRKALKKGE